MTLPTPPSQPGQRALLAALGKANAPALVAAFRELLGYFRTNAVGVKFRPIRWKALVDLGGSGVDLGGSG